MSISLLFAIVLSWTIVRYAGTAPDLKFDVYFSRWFDWFISCPDKKIFAALKNSDFHARLTLLLLVLIPVFVMAIAFSLFGDWLWGLVGWLLGFALLLIACGNDDFDLAILTLQRQLRSGEKLSDSATFTRERLAYISFDRWFAAIFWFVLFGPIFVLAYRSLAILARTEARLLLNPKQADTDDLSEADGPLETIVGVSSADLQSQIGDLATLVVAAIDWLPARIWAVLMLVIGNFSRGLVVLREYLFSLDHGSMLWAVNKTGLEAAEAVESSETSQAPGESQSNDAVSNLESSGWSDNIESLELLLQFNDRLLVAGLVFIVLFAYI